MIMIELDVPSLGERFQMSVDENVPVKELMPDITDVICRSANCELADDEEMKLVYLDGECFLEPAGTLAMQGVADASGLMLI